MPTASDLVTDLPADFEVFGQAVDTSLADLKGGTTDQVLAKNSNTDMDFKWVTSDDANAIQNSIVDAKGDLIAASANDTPARLAVGNNGETLVADSSTSTGLRWQGNFAAGKNKVINGDFGIWQRGTTFTNATVNTYSSDRWFFGGSGNNTGSISRQTFTPGTAPVSGYEGKFFYRLDQTTTAITPSIIQRIEDVQTLAGQQVTVSFWVKTSTNITGGLTNVYLEQFFGSGGSGTVSTLVIDTTNTTTSWTRVSGTVTLPSITGKTVGTSSYLQLTIYPKASTIITFDIWGIQVEAGSVATAFQTATGTIQGELAACQRYYYRNTGTQLYSVVASSGVILSTTTCYSGVQLPVQMRREPTSVDFSGLQIHDSTATSYAVSNAAISAQIGGTSYAGIEFYATGLTVGRTCLVRNANNSAGYLGFSAEL